MLTLVLMAQETKGAYVVRYWLFNLSNRLSAVSSFFPRLVAPPISVLPIGGVGSVSRSIQAMADPGPLPIADQPAIVPISTPEDTPRSRSGHASHNSHQHDIRTIASMSGESTVLYGCEAAREGVPNNANLNVMCQANLQQNFQRNEFTTCPTLNVVTHDPRITEMVESAAEARHQQVVGQMEMQAQNLQEALKIHENEELRRAREVMSSEAMQMREQVTREAEDEIYRQQRNANATVEDYKRVMDRNLRQSISNKDQELNQLREEALLREQRQNAEIQDLRNLVQQQAAANEKLQQMLQQSLRIPTNANVVETATMMDDNAWF